MTVARKAIIGALWTSGANYSSQAIGFVAQAILGRLLLEEEYGLFATANSIIQFIFILSAFSFNMALIQTQEIKEKMYETALTLNVGLSVLSLILTAASVLGYSFFRALSALEVAVIFSLSIANIFNLFGQLFDAILQRNLEFKKTSGIAFAMNLANPLVAVALAFSGAGVWSVIGGQLVAGIVFLGGSYLYSGWKIQFGLSHETARWFFELGWKFLGSRSLEVVYTELDRLIIKSMNSYEQVGIYDRAMLAARYPARVVTPSIINVALPVYSKVQNDANKLSDGYSLVNFFLIRSLLPFGLVFFLIPESFMVGIFGERWISSAGVLKALAAYSVVHPIVENLRVLFYSLGKPEIVAQVRAVQVIIYVPLLALAVMNFGIMGAAWAVVATTVLTYVLFLFRASRHIEYRIWRTFLVPVVFAVLAGLIFSVLPQVDFGIPLLDLGTSAVVIAGLFLLFELIFERKEIIVRLKYFRSSLSRQEST